MVILPAYQEVERMRDSWYVGRGHHARSDDRVTERSERGERCIIALREVAACCDVNRIAMVRSRRLEARQASRRFYLHIKRSSVCEILDVQGEVTLRLDERLPSAAATWAAREALAGPTSALTTRSTSAARVDQVRHREPRGHMLWDSGAGREGLTRVDPRVPGERVYNGLDP